MLRPRKWLRYVDDTFVLWPHGEDELDTFHNHHNAQHQSIQKESDGRIPFLDVLVERKETKLSTRVYRKSTHDHYIVRPPTNQVWSLKNRAEKVCDREHLKAEMVHLKKTFKTNGYPEWHSGAVHAWEQQHRAVDFYKYHKVVSDIVSDSI